MNTLGNRVKPNLYDRHDRRRKISAIHCDFMARWRPVPFWKRALNALARMRARSMAAIAAKVKRA